MTCTEHLAFILDTILTDGPDTEDHTKNICVCDDKQVSFLFAIQIAYVILTAKHYTIHNNYYAVYTLTTQTLWICPLSSCTPSHTPHSHISRPSRHLYPFTYSLFSPAQWPMWNRSHCICGLIDQSVYLYSQKRHT